MRDNGQVRIALAIYRMLPRGGLEDQCLRLARELTRRGHEVTIHTTVPDDTAGIATRVIDQPPWRISNHGRMASFARRISHLRANHMFDRLVSFQPLPGADILFSADLLRNRADESWARRLTPRFRSHARLEQACFSPAANTRVFCLGARQAAEYRQRYDTPGPRLTLLPPSIDPDMRQPERRSPDGRAALRRRLGLSDQQRAWLWLGLQPHTKGLDRAIGALATNPGATLIIGGLAEADDKARNYRAMAETGKVAGRIRWLGYLDRDGVLDSFAAADVLVHPARREVTGGVILEALINGLPVVTTENCGFAEHVTASGCGVVIDERCIAAELARAIATATGPDHAAMSARGILYGKEARLYDGIAVAADLVEAAS